MAPKIQPAVAAKLGHYVYLYVNPLDNGVFYVGKGRGARALAHLNEARNPRVEETIQEIQAAGQKPQIEVLVHGLPDAETALRVEAAAIDLVGVKNLDNEVRGWRGRAYGRMPLEELVAHYTHRHVNIQEPSH